jgi:hypothetical protein
MIFMMQRKKRKLNVPKSDIGVHLKGKKKNMIAPRDGSNMESFSNSF